MTQPDPNPTPTGPAQPPVTEPAKPADAPATGTTQPPATTPSDDKPLGPNGEKALAAEREARRELERKLAALAPLEKLATALGGGDTAAGKTELETLAERQAAMERTLVDERAARWRAEVAHEKGLTPAQAARLAGDTREALAADADALLSLFPTAAAAPGTPAPDMSQGARGGGGIDVDARIAEAMKGGNVTLAVALQNEKLNNTK